MLAHASINGHAITLETSQRILRDIIPVADAQPLSIPSIQETVAEYYGIGVEEMKGKRRDKHIVFPRQVSMYLIREETDSSLPSSATPSAAATTPPPSTPSRRSPSSSERTPVSRTTSACCASACTPMADTRSTAHIPRSAESGSRTPSD